MSTLAQWNIDIGTFIKSRNDFH